MTKFSFSFLVNFLHKKTALQKSIFEKMLYQKYRQKGKNYCAENDEKYNNFFNLTEKQ
jgi:hypothetical protein